MDVFRLHERLIAEYSAFTRSFVDIEDKRIGEEVEAAIEQGLLWPDPWIQLNPMFEAGDSTDELVDQGVLHDECRRIFAIKRSPNDEGRPLRFHRHQSEAIKIAHQDNNYVLTTGTGSGKSLAYIVPIVDRVLRQGSGNGIKAIIVYPMNALANSQAGELEKFLKFGYPEGRGPVTYARYTGQESDDQKESILTDPPDILLTNYVMLELILTRPRERKKLVRSASGQLRFLVLDELHTYRGRQGSDVAMLVRRVRDACRAPDLQCVGTSATLAGGGSEDEQRAEVASVASRLFGAEVKPEAVVGETLRRATTEYDLDDAAHKNRLKARVTQEPPTDRDAFLDDPLASWIESEFGLERSAETGLLVRRKPAMIGGPQGAAKSLAELTGEPKTTCAQAIKKTLYAGWQAQSADATDAQAPTFAFRLHQFLSKGDTVYATLETEDERYLSTEGQVYCPTDRHKLLFPLAFCRECGQEYYTVIRHSSGKFDRRDFGDLGPNNEKGQQAGFLYIDTDEPWPAEDDEIKRQLPESWLIEEDGRVRIDRDRLKDMPTLIHVNAGGTEDPGGLEMLWVPAPFRFCLRCKTSYDPRIRSDYTKIAKLSTEGRSSATSIVTLGLIRGLRSDETLREKARKLLSFTDNRQDASLQAGHFNDFVDVGLLRGALHRAATEAGERGIGHEELPLKVFDALALPFHEYAADPDVKFAAKRRTEESLREVIAYRLFQDLKRGWRVTMPNLEQVGLLQISYEALDELAAAEEEWRGTHVAVADAEPSVRERVARVLLDDLRRNLAINVKWLDSQYQEQLKERSSQQLNNEWAIDENEELLRNAIVFPRSRRKGDWRENYFLSPRGSFGRWLRRSKTFPHLSGRFGLEDTAQIIADLLERLRIAGLVQIVDEPKDTEQVPGYQVVAGGMRWTSGEGTAPFYDPLRTPDRAETGGRANPFFVDYYKRVASELSGLRAREHTAQVQPDVRIEREDAFREATLPILYCSPTMELGIDIAELNAVHLRNVPPTPANYAQRSGRAGRQGQPAIVTTYCAVGSPHDQYFFRRSQDMVFGAVAPPRLDMANEDLIREHVHAIWLAETGQALGRSMNDILDLSKDGYPIQDEVLAKVEARDALERAREGAARLLDSVDEDLDGAHWYTSGWLDEVFTHVLKRFDEACDRWRDLHRAAKAQQDTYNQIAVDHNAGHRERDRARRLRREAESQLDLLTAASSERGESDFYPYRYLASEGFLPGYNFPRLPLSAYIPGRRGKQGFDEYLQRARFLAVSEFGPGALVYHEGSRYQIQRVQLPTRRAEDEFDLPLRSAKQCTSCGYIHDYQGNAGPDVCEHCGKQLDAPFTNLFRMQNVVTRRRERINSDEEERHRVGFELRTGIQFATHGDRPGRERASVQTEDGDDLAELVYGDAATIWRMNLGWRRRSDDHRYGFALDLESGRWLTEQALQQGDDALPEMKDEKRMARVIPYVEDRRNCLIFEPGERLDAKVHASLGAALKTAIQAEFQLEDGELAVDPLPTEKERRAFLLYESAEGGAGVLRRLVRERDALGRVARQALDICHFDPDTGEDRRGVPGARYECEAACYDCLMSYRNQRDHELLDRQAVRDLLMTLRDASVTVGPSEVPRAEHLELLKRACDSGLEREWLDLLQRHDLHLPTHAQKLVEPCSVRPDFLYQGSQTAIFIDGPDHDSDRQRTKDKEADDRLEDAGYTPIRFRYDERDRWLDVIRKYPSVFGEVR